MDQDTSSARPNGVTATVADRDGAAGTKGRRERRAAQVERSDVRSQISIIKECVNDTRDIGQVEERCLPSLEQVLRSA